MAVVAKFEVTEVDHPNDGHTTVRMFPVNHENDPDHVNRKFWEATPSGELDMYITNPGAGAYFEKGAVYTLTFERDAPPADQSTGTSGDDAA
jgi:hypothetical protein